MREYIFEQQYLVRLGDSVSCLRRHTYVKRLWKNYIGEIVYYVISPYYLGIAEPTGLNLLVKYLTEVEIDIKNPRVLALLALHGLDYADDGDGTVCNNCHIKLKIR